MGSEAVAKVEEPDPLRPHFHFLLFFELVRMDWDFEVFVSDFVDEIVFRILVASVTIRHGDELSVVDSQVAIVLKADDSFAYFWKFISKATELSDCSIHALACLVVAAQDDVEPAEVPGHELGDLHHPRILGALRVPPGWVGALSHVVSKSDDAGLGGLPVNLLEPDLRSPHDARVFTDGFKLSMVSDIEDFSGERLDVVDHILIEHRGLVDNDEVSVDKRYPNPSHQKRPATFCTSLAPSVFG